MTLILVPVSVSDFRVKYIRGVQKDRRARENIEVEMLEDGELYDDVGSQQAGKFEMMKIGTELLFVVL